APLQLYHARRLSGARPARGGIPFRAVRRRVLCQPGQSHRGCGPLRFPRGFKPKPAIEGAPRQATRQELSVVLARSKLTSLMSHLDAIRSDEGYAEILANWDQTFYARFTDALRPAKGGARVLDAGCGVGQVVARLASGGFEAHGVDVSGPNIDKARQFSDRCRL